MIRADGFIDPMKAQTLKSDFAFTPALWAVEEKYDGHRMCVAVNRDGRDLFGNNGISAFSRNAIKRHLPMHIERTLDKFPSGVYDAELMIPGKRSFGVTVIEDSPLLQLVIFDVMELIGKNVMGYSYEDRRRLLIQVFVGVGEAKSRTTKMIGGCENLLEFEPPSKRIVWQAPSGRLRSREQVHEIAQEIWERDGEGVMVKRLAAPYQPGKRSRDWLKVKQLRSETLLCVGYAPGKNGPYSTVLLKDNAGILTSVKTRNNYELDRLGADPQFYIGKKLVIEFQEKTPDGEYRHPRWDHWSHE